MEDEEEYDAIDTYAAQTLLGKLGQRYNTLAAREAATLEQLERSRADRLRMAQENIRAMRFGEPTRAQELFALSSAFLSPKPYRGFAGTLANVVPMLGAISSARSSAEDKRAEMLAQLQMQYANDIERQDLDRIKSERQSLLDLMKVYGPLAKPQRARTGFKPPEARLVDMDTGEEIVPPSIKMARIPPQAIEALRAQMMDPNVPSAIKAQTRRNFETMYGVPVNIVLGGQ
jgi:hypothetical protein